MVGSCLRALNVEDRYLPPTLFERVNLFRTLTAEHPFLVVLENATAPAQVLPLLPNGPGSVVLVTSSSDLGELRLDGAEFHTLRPLDAPAGVELFERVCGPARVSGEPQVVQRLVQLCRGLPIAMLVLAGRVAAQPELTFTALLDELPDEDRRPLEGTLTMSAAFTGAYDQLPEPARRLYRGIGMLPSIDITREVAAIIGDVGLAAAGRQLETLASVHLAERLPDGRYRPHPLVRTHAREHAGSEPAESRRRVVQQVIDHYVRTTAFADRALRGQRTRVADHRQLLDTYEDPFAGPDPAAQALGWLHVERAGLVAIVQFAFETGWYPQTWQLAEALTAYYPDYRYLSEWVTTSDLGARAARRCGAASAEARLRSMLSRPYMDYGRFDRARTELDIAQDLAEQTGDTILQASVLEFRGRYLDKTDPEQALAAYDQARRLNADAGEWRGVGLVTFFSGRSLAALGRHTAAIEAFDHALDLLRWVGDTRMAGRVFIALGETYAALERPAQAVAVLNEAVETLDGRHYEAEAREILAGRA